MGRREGRESINGRTMAYRTQRCGFPLGQCGNMSCHEMSTGVFWININEISGMKKRSSDLGWTSAIWNQTRELPLIPFSNTGTSFRRTITKKAKCAQLAQSISLLQGSRPFNILIVYRRKRKLRSYVVVGITVDKNVCRSGQAIAPGGDTRLVSGRIAVDRHTLRY